MFDVKEPENRSIIGSLLPETHVFSKYKDLLYCIPATFFSYLNLSPVNYQVSNHIRYTPNKNNKNTIFFKCIY